MAFKCYNLRSKSDSFLNCVPVFRAYDVSIWLRDRFLVLGPCSASGCFLITVRWYYDFLSESLCTLGCTIGYDGQVGMEAVSKGIHTQLHLVGEILAALPAYQ